MSACRSRVPARRQPSEAAVPIVSVCGVAWIASRSPPGQPGSSLGWWPESAIAQQPYGESGRRVRSLSVTAKRPVGRLAAGAPDGDLHAPHDLAAAPDGEPALRSGRRAATRRRRPRAWRAARIQPGRPFGRSGTTTRSQPPRSRRTETTLGEPNSVRGSQPARRGARRGRRAARSPAGRARSPSARAAARGAFAAPRARRRSAASGAGSAALARGRAAAAGERERAAAARAASREVVPVAGLGTGLQAG